MMRQWKKCEVCDVDVESWKLRKCENLKYMHEKGQCVQQTNLTKWKIVWSKMTYLFSFKVVCWVLRGTLMILFLYVGYVDSILTFKFWTQKLIYRL